MPAHHIRGKWEMDTQSTQSDPLTPSDTGKPNPAKPFNYVCYNCNQFTSHDHPGHKLYRVRSFWWCFLQAAVALVLARAASLLVPPAFRLLGVLTVHGVWLIGASLVCFAYLMTSLTQSARGGASRKLVPQFMGTTTACASVIALDVLLFPPSFNPSNLF